MEYSQTVSECEKMDGVNMRIVFYTNMVSPHQLPLAHEIIKLVGTANYRYIYTDERTQERASLGWEMEEGDWILREGKSKEECREWLEHCDLLLSGKRIFDLFETRTARGLLTIYVSERWFKPIPLLYWFGGCRLYLSGWIRLFHPRYLKMAWRLRKMLRANGYFYYFPIGIHAATDICRLAGLKLKNYETFQPGDIVDSSGKIRLWGYFVASSQSPTKSNFEISALRLLWVGRMVALKRVDTIIRAVELLRNLDIPVQLTLAGEGVMRRRLEASAQGLPVVFKDSVPITRVRNLMHSHNVYILASNAEEGWGAVVSEALEEGCVCVGTYEAGSCATILPCHQLFHSGDTQALVNILLQCIRCKGHGFVRGIGDWSACHAAKVLVQFAQNHMGV